MAPTHYELEALRWDPAGLVSVSMCFNNFPAAVHPLSELGGALGYLSSWSGFWNKGAVKLHKQREQMNKSQITMNIQKSRGRFTSMSKKIFSKTLKIRLRSPLEESHMEPRDLRSVSIEPLTPTAPTAAAEDSSWRLVAGKGEPEAGM
ncbi:Hypothetical predicted protein [Marmota monax]|uniref:Uncharacterized protein n=1 Tax=Marmota monax TaxID=9995 RepID=A0A5E4B6X5_MARMO|nr:Hypothetical predicted protein [Marmota monax]